MNLRVITKHALILAAALSMVGMAQAADLPAGPTAPAYTYAATVTEVVDADTVRMDVDLGFSVWVHGQYVHVADIEPVGNPEDAKKDLESLIKGKSVIIQSLRDVREVAGEDPVIRWAARIWVDGKSVNEAMVAAGHAKKLTP